MSTIRRSSALLLAALAIAAVFFAASQEIDTAQSGAQPEMALAVNPHGERCTDVCAIPLGGTFTLAVEIVTAPAGGYIGAETFIDYGDELSYDIGAQPVEGEIIWPDLDSRVAVKASTGPGLVIHGGLSSLVPPWPVSTYTGSFLEINIRCSPDDTSTQIDLLPFGDPQTITSGTGFLVSAGDFVVAPPVASIQVDCGAGGPLDTPTPTPTQTFTPRPTFTPTQTFTPGPTSTPAAGIIPPSIQTQIAEFFSRPTPGSGDFGDATITFDPIVALPSTGDGTCSNAFDAIDATLVLQLGAGLLSQELCPGQSDANGDGAVTLVDAAVVLQYAAGLLATLPP